MAGSSDGFPDVRVVFGIEVESGRFLIEPDPTDLVLREQAYHRVRGCLRIRSGRLPVVAPEDEIIALVDNVCFGAVREVLKDLHVAVNYTDTYGYLRLDREGDTVRLSGDRVADIRVPTRSLLEPWWSAELGSGPGCRAVTSKATSTRSPHTCGPRKPSPALPSRPGSRIAPGAA